MAERNTRIEEVVSSTAPHIAEMAGVFAELFPDLTPSFSGILNERLDSAGRISKQIFVGLSNDSVAGLLQVFYQPWRHLPESPETILAALRQGCAELRFNPVVLDFAKQQRKAGRKTALVTANMDVFTEVVVPSHGLDSLFDVILNTAVCRTLDKSFLWHKALHALGPGHSFSSSLLIDDSPKMVTAFQSLGGCAFQYRDDDSFRAWLAAAEVLVP